MKTMNKRSLILALMIMSSLSLSATEQIKDKFVTPSGEIRDIYGRYLMSDFFKENPDRRPVTDIVSSALWRGYIAYFQMSREMLYLTDIHVYDNDGYGTISVMNQVFPGDYIVPVLWFSGSLAFPQPSDDEDDDRRYLVFTIENGQVMEQAIRDHYHDLYVSPGPVYGGNLIRYHKPKKIEGASYFGFETMAEINNGQLTVSHFSPKDDRLVYTYPPMDISGREPWYALESAEHKGIYLRSDELLFVYIDKVSHPVYTGCRTGTSSQCMEGLYQIPFVEYPWIGEQQTLSVDNIYVKEIIFSSGILDIDNSESYYDYARPRDVKITNHSTGEIFEVELKDTAHPQSIDLGTEGQYKISTEILTVYPGNKSEDIAINFILAKGW